jgi:ABC-2 type transport system permease protein
MIEFEKKYEIGVRRFGFVNWTGVISLYEKEVKRFLVVWIQTLFSPLITSLLFLLVLSLAIGNERANVLGVPFINFLAPGLIAMSIVQQAFSHSSSSIMIGKIQGTIIDTISAPLNAQEVVTATILAACTRSVIIAAISIFVFSLIIKITIVSITYIIIFTLLSSFILGAVGFVAGLWAEKFDHMASVTNFLIVPLSFLSGTFYSIDRLPSILYRISELNPFFYMIDGFRYGFIGKSDGSIFYGMVYLTILSFVTWFIAYLLYKRGYKIRF